MNLIKARNMKVLVHGVDLSKFPEEPKKPEYKLKYRKSNIRAFWSVYGVNPIAMFNDCEGQKPILSALFDVDEENLCYGAENGDWYENATIIDKRWNDFGLYDAAQNTYSEEVLDA